MIAFAIRHSPTDHNMIELRTGSADSHLSDKPPITIQAKHLHEVIECLLRVAQSVPC